MKHLLRYSKDYGAFFAPHFNLRIVIMKVQISKVITWKEKGRYMKKYNKMLNEILDAVGGKENILVCFHCATRLRLQLKDFEKLKGEVLDNIEGVVGKNITADQLQIIIGPHVQDVYDELCDMARFRKENAIEENMEDGGKLTVRKILGKVVDVISGSFVPLIPIIVAASFIKLLATLLGPSMFNVISAESNLYVLFTFVGDAGFYYLPIFMGYTAAKKMGASKVLGMFMGAIMLHPTLTELVASGQSFTVYGIPMKDVSYASSTIPMILVILVMSYVEKIFKKIIPNSLKMVFVPLCTMLVMLPVALCIIGPLGVNISSGLTNGLLAVASWGWFGSIVVSALGGALWNVLVLCGMHLAYYMAGVTIFVENGSDPLIMPTVIAGTMGILGMSFGALLKFRKDKENRALISGYLATHILGGVTEPAVFGIGMRYTGPFIGACLGGAAGAIYYGISGATITTMMAASNFLIFAQFLGSSKANIINGVIGGVIAAAVSCIYTYLFGFKKKESNDRKGV